jgi:cystathionine beta-lyase/cystathionine gamma-synthase
VSDRRFETRAIHVGQAPDPATGAVIPPIYQTTTFAQRAPGEHQGYEYARTANPTRTALETCLASLEEGSHGLAFASGMAAITACAYLLSPGDAVALPDDVYGGTYRLFVRVLARYGITASFADMTDPATLAGALGPRTHMVLIETPTNPYLKVLDISALADLAHARDALVVVDNTFASPYFQQPLHLGADLVVHSTTKYLGGHSDVIGGFVATNDPTVADRLRFLQKSLGAVPGPFDCWLILRGLRTLAIRMERHCENAKAVAAFLAEHPAVDRVLYPGLADHPGHEVAEAQMRDFGGMISFLVADAEEAAALVARTKVWILAESLGGVESLIEVPTLMTHASTADAPFATPANLVRLSVGIESATDLLADLEQALAPVGAASKSA